MFSDKVKEVTKKLYIFVTQINHELYLDRNGFKLHLDCIFPSGLCGGTGQARIFRRHGRISGDYQFYFCFFQNGIRNFIGADGGTVALAGHHEDWRKRRRYTAFRPPAESAVFETVSGNPQRASGDGKYFHEPGGEYAGTGQCRHTSRPESHGGTAGTEPAQGHGQQPDDHVSGAEHVGTDTDSHQHHGIPGTNGSRTTHGRVCSDSIGDFLFDDGRHHCGQSVPAHQLAEPDHPVVSRWSQPAHCRHHLAFPSA